MRFLINSFLFFLLLQIPLISEETDPLAELVTSCQNFVGFDTPVLSPDGEHVAWTVRHKPEDVYFDHTQFGNPFDTPYCVIQSKIVIKRKNNTDLTEIAVPGKSCFGPAWSPDGLRLAYYSDADGQVELWIYDLKNNVSKKAGSLPLSINITHPLDRMQEPLGKVIWSPNTPEIYALTPGEAAYKKRSPRTVFHYTYDVDDSSETPPSEKTIECIVAFNYETGTYRFVHESRKSCISSLSLSPSGQWVCFVTWSNADSDHPYQELNFQKTDDPTCIRIHKPFYNPISYIWHPSLDQIYCLTKNEVNLLAFSDKDLLAREQLAKISENFNGAVLAFTKDQRSLITHAVSEEQKESLILVSLDDRRIKSFDLPSDWMLVNFIENKKGIAWQSDSNKIAFQARNNEDRTLQSVVQLDINKGHFKQIWKKRALLQPFDFDPNHKVVYAFLEDFDHAKEIYAFDDRLGSGKQFSNIEPSFKSLNPGTFKLFETLVPDQKGGMEKVQTALILPAGTESGDRLPTIVVHYPGDDLTELVNSFGGGDGLGGLPQWLFTNHGFAILLPNLVLQEEAIPNPLEVMTNRLLPQIDAVARHGYIDVDRLGIIGQSYGGYGTAGMISWTNIFRAAVATNGVYDLASFSHHLDARGESSWMGWAENGQGRMGKSLFEDPLRYINNSPFYRADKIFTPLLLVHGCMDDDCVGACKMFSALRGLHRSVELISYRDGWHHMAKMKKKDHLHAVGHILDFFHQHLD